MKTSKDIIFGNGTPNTPSIRFLNAPSTGIFHLDDIDLGFAVRGNNVFYCSVNNVVFKTNVTLEKGAVDDGYLRSNADGVAFWQSSPTQSGSISWNSLYDSLSNESSNDSLTIDITAQTSAPNVTFSLETPNKISDNTFYVKNKTTTSFDLYSTLPVATNIASRDITASAMVRLSNNNIGICYYDVDADRIYYQYSSDVLGTSWSSAILVNNVSAVSVLSMCVVNGNPAIGYIYNEGVNDEWRYVRATNAAGSAWGSPVTLATSSSGVNFLPVSVNLLIVNGNPAYFYNDETGRAKMIRATDTSGATWAAAVNVSNLSNHQIINVKIINGNPAVVAKSNTVNNVYYVRASNANGSSWPVGSTQLYKTVNSVQQTILSNPGKSSCDMNLINGSLCIILSELTTNDLYLNVANDSDGSSWQNFVSIFDAQTTAGYPTFFYNNNNTYLLFNKSNGNPSVKSLIRFTTPTSYTINQNFMPVFNGYSEHIVIPNVNDSNSTILFLSQNNIDLLRFYDDEFKLNWICHV